MEHRDEKECERLRIDWPTVLHCLRCTRRRWHARSLRGWRTWTICSVRPRERGANSWWYRCHLACVSECRSELRSQIDRPDSCRGEHSGDPSRDERAYTCRSAWSCKEGPGRTHPSLLYSAFRHGLQNHTARRLLGQHRPKQYQGERRVTERANCKIFDLRRHC